MDLSQYLKFYDFKGSVSERIYALMNLFTYLKSEGFSKKDLTQDNVLLIMNAAVGDFETTEGKRVKLQNCVIQYIIKFAEDILNSDPVEVTEHTSKVEKDVYQVEPGESLDLKPEDCKKAEIDIEFLREIGDVDNE